MGLELDEILIVPSLWQHHSKLTCHTVSLWL